jgi:hypothetical protein
MGQGSVGILRSGAEGIFSNCPPVSVPTTQSQKYTDGTFFGWQCNCHVPWCFSMRRRNALFPRPVFDIYIERKTRQGKNRFSALPNGVVVYHDKPGELAVGFYKVGETGCFVQ